MTSPRLGSSRNSIDASTQPPSCWVGDSVLLLLFLRCGNSCNLPDLLAVQRENTIHGPSSSGVEVGGHGKRLGEIRGRC